MKIYHFNSFISHDRQTQINVENKPLIPMSKPLTSHHQCNNQQRQNYQDPSVSSHLQAKWKQQDLHTRNRFSTGKRQIMIFQRSNGPNFQIHNHHIYRHLNPSLDRINFISSSNQSSNQPILFVQTINRSKGSNINLAFTNRSNQIENQAKKATELRLKPPRKLNIEEVVELMNESSLKRMSGAENVKQEDIMKLLDKTVQNQMNRFSMLSQAKNEDLKHYFRIVSINQSDLFSQGTFLNLSKYCQTVEHHRQRYQMLITLDGKQIKFQSMINRKLHYNINLDTIQCKFIDYTKMDQNEHLIKFSCGQQTIELVINQQSLPFHLVNDKTYKSTHYLETSAKQISKFLTKAIAKSRGAQFKLNQLPQKDFQFFTKNYATEEQFSQYCQTGDILLFKDDHTFAKIQRTITNSEYDHIAFVSRSQKYGVCLVQANSVLGVSFNVWTHLIRRHWFRGIQSISWRRLLIHSKPQDYENKVQAFILQNKHSKYEITMKKLFTFSSSSQQKQSKSLKGKTYFCSQLVAELYKVLGLLDLKVSSTQYWPKHFSQKGYISMLNNSALDKERIIIFHPSILKQNYKGYSQSLH